MPYGRIKIDTVTFTDGGTDRTIALSGLVNLVSGAISATGALNVNSVTAVTISGTDISGTSLTVDTATATTGNFTSQVSSALVTGTTIQATSLTGVSGTFTTVSSNFVNAGTGTFRRINVPSGTVQAQTLESTNQITGLTVNSNNGNFTSTLTASTFEATIVQNTNKITAETGIFTTSLSGTLITGNKVLATTGHFSTTTVDGPSTFNSQLTVTEKFTSATGVFTAVLSGETITGTTAKFTSVTGQNGYYTNTLSGQTITGAQGKFNTLTGNVISGGTGIFNQISGQTLQVPSLDLASGSFTYLSGQTITGNTGQFTTLTGKTVNAASGFFSYISGATLDLPSFTVNSGNFTNLSGGTITGDLLNVTSGHFNTIFVDAPSTFNTTVTVNQAATIQTGIFPQLLSGAVVTGNAGRFTNLTGVNGTFTTQVFGTTVSGTTGKFNTVTGNRVEATTGIFGTISGTTLQIPSITINSGIYTYLSGQTITGNTGQFTTLTGRTLNIASGLFSYISGAIVDFPSLTTTSGTFTNLSGQTITGDLLNVTSGHFNTILVDAPSTFNTELSVNEKLTAVTGSFTTATGANLNFTNITGSTGRFTQTVSGLVVTGNTGRFTVITGQTITGVNGNFNTVSGNTVTGNIVRSTSGVYKNISGQTITGNTLNVTSGTFDRIVINNAFNTVTSATGIFTSLLSGQVITGQSVNTVSGIFNAIDVGAPSTFNTDLTVNQTLNAQTFKSFGGFTNLTPLQLDRGSIGSGLHVELTSAAYSVVATNKPLRLNSNYASGLIDFRINNSEVARIDSAGNLGIGTASPGQILDVSNNDNPAILLNNSTTNNSSSRSSRLALNIGNTLAAGIRAQTGTGEDASDASLGFRTGGDATSSKMRILANGNVGIGTTSPAQTLDVNGTAKIGAPTGSAYIEVGQGATENRFAYIDFIGDTTYTNYGLRLIRNDEGPNTSSQLRHRGTGNLAFRTEEAADIVFVTNNNERARIDTAGRLLVGTTFNTEDSSLVLEGHSGNGFAQSIVYLNRGNTPGGAGAFLGVINFGNVTNKRGAVIRADSDGAWSTTGGSESYPGRLVFSTTASGSTTPTERMRIDSSGKVGIGTTTPNGPIDVQGTADNGVTHYFGTTSTAASADVSLALTTAANVTRAEISAIREGFSAGGNLAFRINQAGTVNEVARIDSSGRLLVGTTSALSNVYVKTTAIAPQLQVYGNSGPASSLSITRATGAASNLILQRGSTGGGAGNVVDGDPVGQINFNGFDGTNYRNTAQITSEVDGTPGANSVPGRLVFATTASGSASPTERMRINSDGTTVFSGAVTLPSGSTIADYQQNFDHSATISSTNIFANQWVSVLEPGRTITLPFNPADGTIVRISVGNFTDTTVFRNGSNIMNAAANLTIDVAYKTVTLIYDGLTIGTRPIFGWRII